MVILFPLVLVAAAVLVLRRDSGRPAGRTGWRWFAAWGAAGAAMTFSFLTGFSIGLLVLPAAAALTLWIARAAPSPPETIGFVAGGGAVLLITPWQFAGVLMTGVAIVAYAAVRAAHDVSA